MNIPFNRVGVEAAELTYLQEALASGHLARNGAFAERCEDLLREATGAAAALLTHSCTGALELAALLLDLAPGDEVILPSFTFTSTANAVALRGAVPVFVDIRAETLALDERLVKRAIGPKTRAIFVVHYGGVAAEMDALCALAREHHLTLVEDAAQALGATYRGRPLGTFGDMGTLSFHQTKNVICGEGGALLLRDHLHAERAAILRDAGTNRRAFLRGEVDRYSWVDVGSSYAPSELTAAVLLAQLERRHAILDARRRTWQRYHQALASAEHEGLLQRPTVLPDREHNAHVYWIAVAGGRDRARVMESMRERGIATAFHYVPLHSAPAGVRHGRVASTMHVTDDIGARLLRLPMWNGLTDEDVDRVCETLVAALRAP